ncbi:hypothetical protein ACHAXN_007170 [Cyclotella atomus]
MRKALLNLSMIPNMISPRTHVFTTREAFGVSLDSTKLMSWRRFWSRISSKMVDSLTLLAIR